MEKISSQDSKHILLISYTFPPYPGIGGRRWAKFSKYLSRLGYTVHVIHAKNPFKEQSLWVEDIENEKNIKKYELNSLYPKVLLTQPKSILQKLNYKISLLIVRLLSKGTLYDKGIFWRQKMLNTSTTLIKKYDITNVIVNCAPFSTAYYALSLKKKFKNLNLIVDFRDPWTWGSGYGFSTIKGKRKEFEERMEQQVIKNFNTVLVPDIEMKIYLSQKYKSLSHKIYLLSHGFDEDEIVRRKKIPNTTIKLLYYGTLYAGMNSIFSKIATVLSDKNKGISLDIYSNENTYKNLFVEKEYTSDLVQYYAPLLPKELFYKIKFYDYVLIIQPDYAKDFITTKIYEIIFSETPILLISKTGKLSEFIIENKLGLHFTPDNILDHLGMIISYDNNNFRTSTFSVKSYSFKSLTDDLLKYLK
ncbi:MAG: hypothetical protein ABI315_09390 [Bacteroidia bacterium]